MALCELYNVFLIDFDKKVFIIKATAKEIYFAWTLQRWRGFLILTGNTMLQNYYFMKHVIFWVFYFSILDIPLNMRISNLISRA